MTEGPSAPKGLSVLERGVSVATGPIAEPDAVGDDVSLVSIGALVVSTGGAVGTLRSTAGAGVLLAAELLVLLLPPEPVHEPADKGKDTTSAKSCDPPSMRSFSADILTVQVPAVMSLELTTMRSTLLALSTEQESWSPEHTPSLITFCLGDGGCSWGDWCRGRYSKRFLRL